MGKSDSAGQNKMDNQPQQESPESAAGVISRERLISEAAYYKAEQRGFQPGNEMADWFEAENEVDRIAQHLLKEYNEDE